MVLGKYQQMVENAHSKTESRGLVLNDEKQKSAEARQSAAVSPKSADQGER